METMETSGKYGPNTALVEQFFARLREGLILTEWYEIVQAGTFAQPWWDACRRAQDAAAELHVKDLLLATVRDDTRLWYNQHAPKTAMGMVTGAALALATKDRLSEKEFAILYEPFLGIVPYNTLSEASLDAKR